MFDIQEFFNYGVPAGILGVLIWVFARPWSDYLRERHKQKAKIEDEREMKLTQATELNAKTLAELASSNKKLTEGSRVIQAILQSEAQVAASTAEDIHGILQNVGAHNKDREAIIHAIELIEDLDIIPSNVKSQLERIRKSLSEAQKQAQQKE